MKILINNDGIFSENKIILLHNENKISDKIINKIDSFLNIDSKRNRFVDINGGEGIWSLLLMKYFKNINIYENRDNYVKLIKKNKVLYDIDSNLKYFSFKITNRNNLHMKEYNLDNFKLNNIDLIKITSIYNDNNEELFNIIEGMKETLKMNNYPDIVIEDTNNNIKYIEELEKLDYNAVDEINDYIVLYKKNH